MGSPVCACAAECVVYRFTATPIEATDVNTRQVFGDYIDTYDIQRAVADGAPVPLLRSVGADSAQSEMRLQIDPDSEITEGETKPKRSSNEVVTVAMVGTSAMMQIAQIL
jgi:type I restriction enzyme R subunit